MIALPVFGYKNHISIDRRYWFIRAGEVISAAHADGRMLRHVIAENRSSEVWADTEYRPTTNEAWLADRMLTSRVHRRKPKGKPMPKATACANAAKFAIRPGSSMCSRSRKTGSGCSSAPSASSGQSRNSPWPIWPITSTARSSTNDASPQHETALTAGNGHEVPYPMIKKTPAIAPSAPVMPP